ncbi:MAG: hypothetical protein GY754_17180 [bacterium]|nr:hypothetical protein [bacterium]
MKIDIDKLITLLKKYPHEFECTYGSTIVAGGKKFRKGSDVVIQDLNIISGAEKQLDIFSNITLYEYLIREYPLIYRMPTYRFNFHEIDQRLLEFDAVNKQSQRSRFLYVLGDYYGTEVKSQKKGVVLRDGDKLNFQKWNSIKDFIDNDQIFFCRNSENGILLFMDLTTNPDVNYTERFNKHTGLLTAMVNRPVDKTSEISPEFIPSEDINSVTDPQKLLDEYCRKKARMIIIGEYPTDQHKKALLAVKEYDPFVRIMVVPKIDLNNIEHFFLQVKMVYNSDPWN